MTACCQSDNCNGYAVSALTTNLDLPTTKSGWKNYFFVNLIKKPFKKFWIYSAIVNETAPLKCIDNTDFYNNFNPVSVECAQDEKFCMVKNWVI